MWKHVIKQQLKVSLLGLLTLALVTGLFLMPATCLATEEEDNTVVPAPVIQMPDAGEKEDEKLATGDQEDPDGAVEEQEENKKSAEERDESEENDDVVGEEVNELEENDDAFRKEGDDGEEDNSGSNEDTNQDEELEISEKMELEAQTSPGLNTVTLVGQWTNESRQKINTTRVYENAEGSYDSNSIIGLPSENGGLLRGLAKTFLGWSNIAPEANGNLPTGARLYSPYDTIGMVFPNEIPEGAKLYAVYFSLNDPDTAWPEGVFALFNLITDLKEKLTPLVNINTVFINSFIQTEDVLPFTDNASEAYEGNKRTIIDYYKTTEGQNQIHEVVLEAQHSMEPTLAMLVYKNPIGSNQVLPILSRDYATKYANNGFNTSGGVDADYTYMDLVVQIDPEIKMPDGIIYLQFDSYTWRPLFVLDADKNPLPILDPHTENKLGNEATSLNSLVSTADKTTTFAVDLSTANLINTGTGKQELTLRTVLRKYKVYGMPELHEISEASLIPSPGKTRPETIQENMQLRALTSQEVRSKNNTLSLADAQQRVVTISDAKAKEMAETGKKLKVTGYIEGLAVVDAGQAQKGRFKLNLRGSVPINVCPANVIELGYVLPEGEPTNPPVVEYEEPTPENKIRVEKVWGDNQDAAGIRPASVELELLANDKPIGIQLSLEAYSSWVNYIFGDFPVEDEQGNPIVYTLRERPVEGYESWIIGNIDDGFTVYNSLQEAAPPPEASSPVNPQVYELPRTGQASGSEAYGMVSLALASIVSGVLIKMKKKIIG